MNSNQSSDKAEAVLLVDDDELYVRAMTRQLRALGYPYVFRASSAAEATDMLQRVRATVVLTDMAMESQEAGQQVLAAARKLGVSAAVVSGRHDLDEGALGVRLCCKAGLDLARLEQLMTDLVAEHRVQRRASAYRLRASVELSAHASVAARRTA